MSNPHFSDFTQRLPSDSSFVVGYLNTNAGGNSKYGWPAVYNYILQKYANDEEEVIFKNVYIDTLLTVKNITILESLGIEGVLSVAGELRSFSGRRISTIVFSASGDVNVLPINDVAIINKTVGAATAVSIPASDFSTLGQRFIIKDGKGDAAVNNITITPASGTIDGQPNYEINTNYGYVALIDNGTEYNVIAASPLI